MGAEASQVLRKASVRPCVLQGVFRFPSQVRRVLAGVLLPVLRVGCLLWTLGGDKVPVTGHFLFKTRMCAHRHTHRDEHWEAPAITW